MDCVSGMIVVGTPTLCANCLSCCACTLIAAGKYAGFTLGQRQQLEEIYKVSDGAVKRGKKRVKQLYLPAGAADGALTCCSSVRHPDLVLQSMCTLLGLFVAPPHKSAGSSHMSFLGASYLLKSRSWDTAAS